MNFARIPRLLVIILIVFVLAALVVGTIHAFTTVRATSGNPPTQTSIVQMETTPTLGPSPSPSPTPIIEASADTVGVTALAVILLVIVIFGVIWGRRMTTPQLPKPRK